MTRLYLTVIFKITAILVGVVLGCPPVRREFVLVIAVREQVRSSEACPLAMSVSWRVKMHYLYGCQACVRCIEGVRISEGQLWEVPLYMDCERSTRLCGAHSGSPQLNATTIRTIR